MHFCPMTGQVIFVMMIALKLSYVKTIFTKRGVIYGEDY